MVPTVLGLSLAIILTVGPILGAAVGLTGIILLEFAAGGATQLAITAVWNALTDFTLSAVPVFIILGEILLRSGLSERVYGGLSPLFSNVPGRLLHTNIAVAGVFAAVSGSSTSTAAAVGTVGFAELERRKYHLPTVVGSLAAGGTLGLLIPPSLSLIIYGATQDVSIGKLFIAGILPGLLMALVFMGYLAALSTVNRNLVPASETKADIAGVLRGLVTIWPLPILIFSVLGTIYLGIATPTESAALGVATAIVLGFTVGNLTLAKLWEAFSHATAVFAAVALMFVGTLILSQAISLLAIPTQIVEAIDGYGLSKYMTFFLICLVYLILGCFFDGISLLLMTLPVVFPLMMHLGFDPIWFGIIVTILVEVGMITPPIGMNLYVLVAISRQQVSLAQAAAAATPYWIAMLLAILLFTLFPNIILILPSLY